MKRTPLVRKTRLNPVRRKLRRGEPTKAEKEAARAWCYSRALGTCAACGRYAPLNSDDEIIRGNLCHAKSKRRFGWFENLETGQYHIWMHGGCHSKSHNSKGKPCPPNPR
jgi:hypothetical protein